MRLAQATDVEFQVGESLFIEAQEHTVENVGTSAFHVMLTVSHSPTISKFCLHMFTHLPPAASPSYLKTAPSLANL